MSFYLDDDSDYHDELRACSMPGCHDFSPTGNYIRGDLDTAEALTNQLPEPPAIIQFDALGQHWTASQTLTDGYVVITSLAGSIVLDSARISYSTGPAVAGLWLGDICIHDPHGKLLAVHQWQQAHASAQMERARQLYAGVHQ
jgi:hypothetical protein